MTAHPSHLRLDAFALGASGDPALHAHLAGCRRCAAVIAARRTPAEELAWVGEVRIPRRRHRFPARAWLGPALALAAAAVLAVAVGPRLPRGPGPRAKGTPAVAIYLKRGDTVQAWDGRARVRPGDRLRLGIRGGGFRQVSVASLPPGGAPALLYAGPLAADGETLLPVSFRVDLRGDAEVVSVILADGSIAAGEHARAEPSARAGSWSVRITLPKEALP
jgi:hypothetical protein